MVRNYKRETEKGNTDIPNLVKESIYRILPMSHHLVDVCLFLSLFSHVWMFSWTTNSVNAISSCMLWEPWPPVCHLNPPDNVVTASIALLQPCCIPSHWWFFLALHKESVLWSTILKCGGSWLCPICWYNQKWCWPWRISGQCSPLLTLLSQLYTVLSRIPNCTWAVIPMCPRETTMTNVTYHELLINWYL